MGVCLYRECFDGRGTAVFGASLCASACTHSAAGGRLRCGRGFCRCFSAPSASRSGGILRQDPLRRRHCAYCVRQGAVAVCACDGSRLFHTDIFTRRDPDCCSWAFRNRDDQRHRILCGTCACRPCPWRVRMFCSRRGMRSACIAEVSRIQQEFAVMYAYAG